MRQVSYCRHGQDGPVVTWWQYGRRKKKNNNNNNNKQTIRKSTLQQSCPLWPRAPLALPSDSSPPCSPPTDLWGVPCVYIDLQVEGSDLFICACKILFSCCCLISGLRTILNLSSFPWSSSSSGNWITISYFNALTNEYSCHNPTLACCERKWMWWRCVHWNVFCNRADVTATEDWSQIESDSTSEVPTSLSKPVFTKNILPDRPKVQAMFGAQN